MPPSRFQQGRYELLGRLGRGGTAEVYRVLDTKTGEEYAAKLVEGEHQARAAREGAILDALDHLNIVRVHARFDEGPWRVILMELCAASVADEVHENGPLAEARVVEVGRSALSALALAHARGVVHRDIKPQNLLLTEEGVLRVADFGVAAWTADSKDLTRTGAVLGSVPFMAPEQRRGEPAGVMAEALSIRGDVVPHVAPGGLSSDEGLRHGTSPLPRGSRNRDGTGHHPKEEREIQQIIARDNNIGSVSRATDYYVCDIEYANAHGRFDIVGVHWPSTGADRKQSAGRRLVVGEVKQGDNALSGKAGLHAHVRDVDGFLSDPARLAGLKEEMVAVFNQKRALELINCGRDLESFSDEPPLFLLILANHDPDKTKLREELATLPSAEHCEIRVVTSSLVGYGLFDPGVLTVDEVLARPETSL